MKFQTTAPDRKTLVKALAGHLGEEAVYSGPRSFAYTIGPVTVDREGAVILPDDLDGAGIQRFLESKGWLAPVDRLTISVPAEDLTVTAMYNLLLMLYSKGNLTYTYTTSDGKTVVIKPQDILHIPGLGFDGIIGYSPIALEKNAIGLGIASEEYGSKFFSNGARPSGILTHPNTVKNPKAVRESWNSAYGGSSNSNRVAILEEGMTFTPLSIPNNEAQFLETRKFQVDEICRIFRVPPHLVGNLEHATFSNIEHQSIDFAVHTIRPWLVRIEQAMNRALFTDQEKGRFYVQFNIDGLMRGDYKSRMEGYAIARQNGWMSANDIRALENQNPIPKEEGGDAYLVNGNMIPITTAMKAQPPAEPTQTAEQRSRERK